MTILVYGEKTGQDVQKLRKAVQLKEAREAALSILAADPRDFKTKSELEWVLHGLMKRTVEKMKAASGSDEPISNGDIDEVTNWMVEFYELGPRVPGWACSNVLRQLSKVGKHIPRYPGFVRWVGLKGMGSEDWNQTTFQETMLQPVALVVARALCKWIKAHPDAPVEDMAFALEWAEKVRPRTHEEDTLWLRWDMAILLRKMGDFQRATELLTSVIKSKRNEFWVWAEAGRLYQFSEPELARSCFCRALEYPAEPKFLVKVHRELAELLAEEEYAQASQEVAITIDIRQAEGWPVGREKLIQGQLCRNPKGFAFVDDAFVAPYVVESVASSVNDVSALALFGKHPTKGERSWRVIKLNAV